eukprot:SAG22_NODE_8948_length_619_cov_1.015385_1_plen_62_part_10
MATDNYGPVFSSILDPPVLLPYQLPVPGECDRLTCSAGTAVRAGLIATCQSLSDMNHDHDQC